jgi:hypothetical protein
MTAPIDPIPPAAPSKHPFQIRGITPWIGSTLVVLFVLALLRTCAPLRNVLLPSRQPSISHSIVVQQVEAVSKLVTSEVTLRDVVTYEDTWMRSTKRSVVLVTGKVLVGFNLQSANVDIDHATKRITVKLPRARVLAIDIMKLETFDERRGLWNPFTPTDRDAIYSVARAQLQKAVMEMNAVPHANESAKQMLERLLSTDGYTVEVEFSAPSPLEKRATG